MGALADIVEDTVEGHGETPDALRDTRKGIRDDIGSRGALRVLAAPDGRWPCKALDNNGREGAMKVLGTPADANASFPKV